jgi:hypothetical protein
MIMSRKVVLALLAVGALLAGCGGQSAGEFAQEHKGGLIGAGIGAGVGALAGQAIGHNTGSTLLGAAVGGGIGYLLGNTQDKKRAEQYDRYAPTPLTGSHWRVQRLSMPNPPTFFQEMYLSFEPGSQLVTTQVMPDGRVIQASETYRIVDRTLIINRPAAGGRPGYIINADYNISGNILTINSPDFHVECSRVNQVPAAPPTATAPPF